MFLKVYLYQSIESRLSVQVDVVHLVELIVVLLHLLLLTLLAVDVVHQVVEEIFRLGREGVDAVSAFRFDDFLFDEMSDDFARLAHSLQGRRSGHERHQPEETKFFSNCLTLNRQNVLKNFFEIK